MQFWLEAKIDMVIGHSCPHLWATPATVYGHSCAAMTVTIVLSLMLIGTVVNASRCTVYGHQ